MSRLGDLKVRGADAGARALSRLAGGHYLKLDYPPAAEERPRYGHGRPAHARLEQLIRAQSGSFAATLRAIGGYADELAAIELKATDPRQPSWLNGMVPGLDAACFYGFVRERRPARYLEIGSGASTKFVARAKRDGGLATRIVSTDPHPRAEIDSLCDRVVRRPLELGDLGEYARTEPNDVVFFDGSHRAFMNSDATAFFLDVVPSLPAGVLVGVHDVYLPDDYPDAVADRHWSEQYLLAAWLLGGADVEIVLPAWRVSRDPVLGHALDPLWARPGLGPVERHGVSFWFETR